MSNGSLMRCTPLIVFTSGLSNLMEQNQNLFEDLKLIMLTDVRMTHPNTSIHRIIMTYTLAIHSLLNFKSDSNI